MALAALNVFQPSLARAATSARNLSATIMITTLIAKTIATTPASLHGKDVPRANAGDAPTNVVASARTTLAPITVGQPRHDRSFHAPTNLRGAEAVAPSSRRTSA
jgi:hypothetical protein